MPVSPCGHPPGLRNIPVYLRRWLTRKLGAAFTSGGLKPGATEPPYTGGTLADFSRASPTAGALANFRPVTLVFRGATIAEFLLALFPPIRGSTREKCFEHFESDISGSFVPGAISTWDFA